MHSYVSFYISTWIVDFGPWAGIIGGVIGIGGLLVTHKDFSSKVRQAHDSERVLLKFAIMGLWVGAVLALWCGVASLISGTESTAQLMELRARLAPRVITPEQRMEILKSLKPASQDRIQITWWPHDAAESREYAESIANLLITAGFNVECILKNIVFMDGESGVRVFSSTEPNPLENVRRIRTSFTENRIIATYGSSAELNKEKNEPHVIIYVLPRALP